MVHIPFLSKYWNSSLRKRKGGGSSGGGCGSSGRGSRSSNGKKGGANGSPATTFKPVAASRSHSATPYGPGGGRSSIIPGGQLFAGRSEGGGTRAQIFGNRFYGSGYPGYVTRGVENRPLPFYYWPVVFLATAAVITSNNAYLYRQSEYGLPSNTSRPGGVLMLAQLPSASSGSESFRILSDNATLVTLIYNIASTCSKHLGNTSEIVASAYETGSMLVPEQAVQFYRASSVVLTLDDYNDTSVFKAEGSPDVPLPPSTDLNLLTCLNETIGQAVPLVSRSRNELIVPSSMIFYMAISAALAVL